MSDPDAEGLLRMNERLPMHVSYAKACHFRGAYYLIHVIALVCAVFRIRNLHVTTEPAPEVVIFVERIDAPLGLDKRDSLHICDQLARITCSAHIFEILWSQGLKVPN